MAVATQRWGILCICLDGRLGIDNDPEKACRSVGGVV